MRCCFIENADGTCYICADTVVVKGDLIVCDCPGLVEAIDVGVVEWGLPGAVCIENNSLIGLSITVGK